MEVKAGGPSKRYDFKLVLQPIPVLALLRCLLGQSSLVWAGKETVNASLGANLQIYNPTYRLIPYPSSPSARGISIPSATRPKKRSQLFLAPLICAD